MFTFWVNRLNMKHATIGNAFKLNTMNMKEKICMSQKELLKKSFSNEHKLNYPQLLRSVKFRYPTVKIT